MKMGLKCIEFQAKSITMYQPSPPLQKPLPTMYDLPSEEVGDSGLPDQFHFLQAALLSETCQPPSYPQERILTAIDLNLYYDSRHPRRYKRPDWFMALDVPNSAKQEELRWSYVVWQESVSPFLVVELLYDRYHNNFRAFRLEGTTYQEQELTSSQLWFQELGLGLGVWEGPYKDISGLWLRWYDAQRQWVPTEAERTEQERQRASLAEANVIAKDQAIRQKDQTIAQKDQEIARLLELLKAQE
jgi:Uma2 family endonuclease